MDQKHLHRATHGATHACTLVALALLVVLTLTRDAHAHGLMTQPRTRGAYRTEKAKPDLPLPVNPTVDYCPHCQNGGGAGMVSMALGGLFSQYMPTKDTKPHAGLCGDRVDGTEHLIGGRFVNYPSVPIVAGYEPGSTADFEAELDTNHNGFFEFYICNLDKCGTADIDDKCFKQGHCMKLKRSPIARCQNPVPSDYFECAPVDNENPGRWYVPCRRGEHVGMHIVGGKSGTMRYQLPPGLSCKHCVVQWYWVTANSCNPPGFKEYFMKFNNPLGNSCPGDGGATGGINRILGTCGGKSFPEEFWGCADITIQPGASVKELSAIQLTSSVDPNSDDDDDAPTPVVATPSPAPVVATPSPAPVGGTPLPAPVGPTPSSAPVGGTPSSAPVGPTPSPAPVDPNSEKNPDNDDTPPQNLDPGANPVSAPSKPPQQIVKDTSRDDVNKYTNKAKSERKVTEEDQKKIIKNQNDLIEYQMILAKEQREAAKRGDASR